MYCENCGAWVSDSDKVCEECGVAIASVVKKPSVANSGSAPVCQDPYANINKQEREPAVKQNKPANSGNNNKPNNKQKNKKKPPVSDPFESSPPGEMSFVESFFTDEPIVFEPPSTSEIVDGERENGKDKGEDIKPEVPIDGNVPTYSDPFESIGFTPPVEAVDSPQIDDSSSSGLDSFSGFEEDPLFSSPVKEDVIVPVYVEQDNSDDVPSVGAGDIGSDAVLSSEPSLTESGFTDSANDNNSPAKGKKKMKKERIKAPKKTKSKRSSPRDNKKTAIIVIAVGLVVCVVFGLSRFRKDKPEEPSTTVPTGFSEMSTTEPIASTLENDVTITADPSDIPFANVYMVKESQLIKVPDAKECGRINSVDYFQGIMTLTTDQGYVIAFKTVITDSSQYLYKDVAIDGSFLMQNVSAENVYLYEKTGDSTTKVEPTTESTTVMTPPSTEVPVVSIPDINPPTTVTTESSTSTTKPVERVSVISASEADRLKNKWAKDPTLLGSESAYFITVKSADFNNQNQFVILSTNNKFIVSFGLNGAEIAPGTKLVVTGIPTSAGVSVSSIYIIK